MNAEIISIGTELLLGHIVNTNTAFISQKLAEIGIDVYHQSVVGDNPKRIAESINKAASRSDIIITTGGLGPTVDDVTIETIASLLHKKLILNKTILKDLKDYFKLRRIKVPQESMRQAYIPEGIKWIRNKVGSAPALIADYKGKVIICLPGPPRELNRLVEDDIIPYVKKISGAPWVIRSRTIKIVGGAESQVNGKVKDLLALKPPTTVGIYAKLGEVELKIMTKDKSAVHAARSIARVENKIRARLKDQIFGCDDETIEGSVARLLTGKRMTIAVAESCTGGLVSDRLTDVPGSSKYFIMGLAAYSNDIKVNLLGVSPAAIQKYGAVSKIVAFQMAKGARFLACTDIGIGITGLAGPGGGTRSKPVGLVYIALVSGKKSIVKECRFSGSRKEIKFQASQAVLDLVRRQL
ncbi:MAG: competence/damage-inducible protein A [Candidatus Omnitrophota bacterium]